MQNRETQQLASLPEIYWLWVSVEKKKKTIWSIFCIFPSPSALKNTLVPKKERIMKHEYVALLRGGRKESASSSVTCPRRVCSLGGHDRHPERMFWVRMLPVRRQSFALLHTHPGEQIFIMELLLTQRAHTPHILTDWKKRKHLSCMEDHTQEGRDLLLECC